jgi:hypothetical protein
MKKTTLPLLALGLALSACQTMPKVKPVYGLTNPTPEAAANLDPPPSPRHTPSKM